MGDTHLRVVVTFNPLECGDWAGRPLCRMTMWTGNRWGKRLHGCLETADGTQKGVQSDSFQETSGKDGMGKE